MFPEGVSVWIGVAASCSRLRDVMIFSKATARGMLIAKKKARAM